MGNGIFIMLLVLILEIIAFYLVVKLTGKYSIYWRLGAILLLIIFELPITLFALDKYNIATDMLLYDFVPLDRWIPFFYDCAGAIIGGSFSGLIVLLASALQSKSMKDENEDQKRINNLPLLKYDFEIMPINFECDDIVDLVHSGDGYHIVIRFFVTNVGMNSIRRFYVNVKSNRINDRYHHGFIGQGIIEKDEKKALIFRCYVDKKSDCIKWTVFYQDILSNWYKQDVTLELEDIFYHKMYIPAAKMTIYVGNEILLGKNAVLNVKKRKLKC